MKTVIINYIDGITFKEYHQIIHLDNDNAVALVEVLNTLKTIDRNIISVHMRNKNENI